MTGPTGPAHEPRRRPATSPPAKINPASSASPDASNSTASDPQAKRKAIGPGSVDAGFCHGLPELTGLMAGGAELEQLAHELEGDRGESEAIANVARALLAETETFKK